jgi:poly(3-hydroxybutyrate) depolymerase
MLNKKWRSTDTARRGRLEARPAPPTNNAPTGIHPLGLAATRDALLYVPPGYDTERPAPLMLMLHGAGGTADGGFAPVLPLADAANMVVLSPASRGRTWDVILGGYGPDVQFIDEALAQTFRQVAVDPARIAIAGFSDGASYALSLGLTNGDLFSHIIAFAPGFMVLAAQEGMPPIYITHGTHDAVLPIERCSRRIVPQLEQAGYAVRYIEFDGGHTVPPDLAREAVAWFTGTEA